MPEIVALRQVVVPGGKQVRRTKRGRRHEGEQRDGGEVEQNLAEMRAHKWRWGKWDGKREENG